LRRPSRILTPAETQPDRSITRCSVRRALYHDGWKAVGIPHSTVHCLRRLRHHQARSTRTSGSCTTSPRIFSEVHDLATERPEKLEELKTLWWSEAEKFQSSPAHNQPASSVNPRTYAIARSSSVTWGPISRGARTQSQESFFRHYRRNLPRDQDDHETAWIVAHGGHAGWVRRLHR